MALGSRTQRKALPGSVGPSKPKGALALSDIGAPSDGGTPALALTPGIAKYTEEGLRRIKKLYMNLFLQAQSSRPEQGPR